jgi:ribosome-associated protein
MSKEEPRLDVEGCARIAAEAAADKKAMDVVAMFVGDLLVVTDYFVVATGANDRQVSAIADQVEEQLRVKCGIKPIGREGERENTWVLLDFGDLVVHVFQPSEREFYRLEKLWSDAPRVDLPADVINATAAAASGDDGSEPAMAGDA